jgi:hypothetical protein
MAKKILVPVFPTESFYDAVVAAGDLLAAEGGMVTFLFTETRAPEEVFEADADGHPSRIEVSEDGTDLDQRDLEHWQDLQIEGLDEARDLLAERGIGSDRVEYVFADQADNESAAQAIADEAAAGAYDLVVLARAYFADAVDQELSTPEEVASAIRGLNEVRLLVT